MLQMPDPRSLLRWRRDRARCRAVVVAFLCLLCLGACTTVPDEPDEPDEPGQATPTPAGPDPALAADEPAPAAAPRTIEELQQAFDKRRAWLRRLNSTRASANAGSIVLRLTVTPAGSVVECRIVSTDFDDPAFNAAIVAQAWRLHLGPREVAEFTYPAYALRFSAPERTPGDAPPLQPPPEPQGSAGESLGEGSPGQDPGTGTGAAAVRE